MHSVEASIPELEFHPLTLDRWKDLEKFCRSSMA